MGDLIFLIGFRAVGKTTIGKELADRLGFEFVDTDMEICRQQNATVRQIVDQSGWPKFRRLEAQALARVAGQEGKVIATGGGAILHRTFWAEVDRRAFVVWLRADRATLVARIRQDEASKELRPSLTGLDSCAEIDRVLAEREPLYQQTAHLAIHTDQLAIPEAVARIERQFKIKREQLEK